MPPPAPGVAVAPPRKRKAPLIIGIAGGLILAAGIVVLVLFLTVWKGEEAGASEPVQLAEKYMQAVEEGDVDAYMDCFEPDFFSMEDIPMLEDVEIDVRDVLEMSFSVLEADFKDVKLKVESQHGDEATVVTTGGTLKVSALGFDREIDLREEPLTFEVMEENGRWYLTADPMPSSIFDAGDFEMDMDEFDFDDYFPEDMDLDMDMDGRDSG